jgi:hypothetical protein
MAKERGGIEVNQGVPMNLASSSELVNRRSILEEVHSRILEAQSAGRGYAELRHPDFDKIGADMRLNWSKRWVCSTGLRARTTQAEREPEIVRAQKLQIREAQGQGDARSGSWRFGVAKHGARLLGRYRWAQQAWLRRQHDLRFGSAEVKLRI